MGFAMQYNNIVQAQYLPCTPPSSDLQRPSSLDLPSHSSSTPWMKLVGCEKALMWSCEPSTAAEFLFLKVELKFMYLRQNMVKIIFLINFLSFRKKMENLTW
jgi:hypothetical protein